MDFSIVPARFAFLIVHITNFELPLVLWGTSLAAIILARVLALHNARLREAKLARNIAAFYMALWLAIQLASVIFS